MKKPKSTKRILLGASVLVGCLGLGMITYRQSLVDEPKPDDSRFTPVVLAQDLDEPMVFEVTKSGDVYIAERKGAFKKYDALTKTTQLIANIPVNTKYTSAEGVVREAEEGLIGMTLDPGFETNNFVYLYYAHPTEKKHILTRWVLKDDQLVKGSEKVMLEIGTQREVCCHTGGGMTWDKAGNLYMTVGNNTGNQQAAQTDERPGRASWDDQGHAGSTMDLRGKILRIHPEKDGTYTIPEGNLFPKGTANTRPEIYTMGHRNAWRPSIDSKTGFLYWGEVGPDASEDTEIGPRGYDELNQARKPGFFGWPWFVGDRQAFPVFDYAANKPLEKKNPDKVVNTSPNNTGLKELPAVAPSFIYYPYATSEKFPLVGTGGRSATGGPVYHRSDFAANAPRPFPAYYEGKWLATDLARGWIMAISMEPNGDYKSMERFLPSYHPIEPIDMKFGPDGDLYVLEYGSTWFAKSPNSQLVRIEYNGGNRKPSVAASASKSGGTVPFKVGLSSADSKDPDGDALKYSWKVVGAGTTQSFATANPQVTLAKPGVYTATLTVTDPKGLSNTKSVKVIAGNEQPVVAMNVAGNKSFFFPDKPINYTVSVNDKEDGSLAAGKISGDRVAVSIDYTSEGFDQAELIQSQRSVDASTQYAVAQALIASSDCRNCHNIDSKSAGPAFTQIAAKYKGDEGAYDRLAKKIRAGGNGVWGETNMPAHPAITMNDATTILKYIMHIQDKTISSLPTQGSYTAKVPEGDNGRGTLVLRAAYTDKGNKTVPPATAEQTLVLRSPMFSASSADVVKDIDVKANSRGSGANLIPVPNGYAGFKKLDLTGIKQIEVGATATAREGNPGGTVEIRLDSPTGELLGQGEVAPTVQQRGGGAQAAQDAGGAAARPANANGAAGAAGGAGAANQQAARPAAQQAATNPFRPAAGATINIKEVSGMHDVYLVFKNSSAKAVTPLMSVSTVRFIN